MVLWLSNLYNSSGLNWHRCRCIRTTKANNWHSMYECPFYPKPYRYYITNPWPIISSKTAIQLTEGHFCRGIHPICHQIHRNQRQIIRYWDTVILQMKYDICTSKCTFEKTPQRYHITKHHFCYQTGMNIAVDVKRNMPTVCIITRWVVRKKYRYPYKAFFISFQFNWKHNVITNSAFLWLQILLYSHYHIDLQHDNDSSCVKCCYKTRGRRY